MPFFILSFSMIALIDFVKNTITLKQLLMPNRKFFVSVEFKPHFLFLRQKFREN
jgi:hypothetical protein